MVVGLVEFTDVLSQAFGHISNPAEMNEYSTKGGDFGLDAFVSDIVMPVLDVVPITDIRYDGLYDVIETLCNGLATRLQEYMQVSTFISLSFVPAKHVCFQNLPAQEKETESQQGPKPGPETNSDRSEV